MSIIYFGNHNVGCACLETLVQQDLRPSLVVVYSEAPGECISYESVASVARKYNIETFVFERSRAAEILERVRAEAPEYLISVAWRDIFHKELLSIPSKGAINVHGSFLPRCRGANPTNWAIISGESETGVTIHFIDEGVDTGDIIIQERLPILPEDTAYSLRQRQDELAPKLMSRLVPFILSGEFPRLKQDEANATYFKPRKPKDGLILWETMSSKDIWRFVRALTRPYPGAFCFLDGAKLVIWEVEVIEEWNGADAAPGTILSVDGEGMIVAAKTGCVRLKDFEFCGDERIPAVGLRLFHE